MGGEAGILALLTAPIAILLMLGGLGGAIVQITVTKQRQAWAAVGFMLFSLFLAPLGGFVFGGATSAVATWLGGPVWPDLLTFPGVGLGVAVGLSLGAFIATSIVARLGTMNNRPKPKGCDGQPGEPRLFG